MATVSSITLRDCHGSLDLTAPFSCARFDRCMQRVVDYLNFVDQVFVVDAYANWDPEVRARSLQAGGNQASASGDESMLPSASNASCASLPSKSSVCWPRAAYLCLTRPFGCHCSVPGALLLTAPLQGARRVHAALSRALHAQHAHPPFQGGAGHVRGARHCHLQRRSGSAARERQGQGLQLQ